MSERERERERSTERGKIGNKKVEKERKINNLCANLLFQTDSNEFRISDYLSFDFNVEMSFYFSEIVKRTSNTIFFKSSLCESRVGIDCF